MLGLPMCHPSHRDTASPFPAIFFHGVSTNNPLFGSHIDASRTSSPETKSSCRRVRVPASSTRQTHHWHCEV
jgi:hypothetical protein